MISYDSGNIAGVTSEWLADKLKVLEEWGCEVTLVTNLASQLTSSSKLKVIRVPSLAWSDFNYEMNLLEDGLDERFKSFPLFMHKFLSWTIGRVFDFVFNFLAGNRSDGKWSWVLTAGPVVLFHSLGKRNLKIFSTGGPSSAHFAGLLAKYLLGARMFVEFQDPFIGSEMKLSRAARAVMTWLEALLVYSSVKTVFVTKAAAEIARSRVKNGKDKITSIYPGSLINSPISQTNTRQPGDEIIFTHLGTLYGERNLDVFFEALDQLVGEGLPNVDKVRVINRGGLYIKNEDEYLQRSSFRLLEPLGRDKALESCQDSSFLLLVQHTDSRSLETIPFKTYDYMKLNIPIFGILQNPELIELLEERRNGDVVSDATDLESVVVALRSAIESFPARKLNFDNGLDTRTQFNILLSS